MRPPLPRGFAALALLLLLGGCAASYDGPELLFHNGRIFTVDGTQPWAEAVLIRGERIHLVGTSAELLAAASPSATVVDLGGRLVVPGLNDAHAHIQPPFPGTSIALTDNPTADPPTALMLDSLRAAAARVPAGEWISITISSTILADPRARRAALDVFAPDHPVMLRAWSGHGTILNSAALTALGVADDAADPLGGWFERDAAGRLTGLAQEYAEFSLVGALPPSRDSAAVATAFRQQVALMVRWGVTSVQSYTLGHDPATLAAVLPGLADLPVRLRIVPAPLTTPAGRDLAPWAALRAPAGGMITVSGTKYILDGTPVERLAMLRQRYQDRDTHGRMNFPADTLRAILQDALTRNEQLHLHAVGDSTIATLFALMREVAPAPNWQPLRVRLEHGDFLAPDLIPQARQLGVVLVQNPSHFTIVPEYMSRLDADRRAWVAPMRSAMEAGVLVGIGSDGPPNPFLNMMFALMHPANPAETLTIDQALRAYTIASAYGDFAERDRGAIAAGMLADLAVLSQDLFAVPLEALPGTESVLTLVGGRAVWDPMGWVGGR